MNTTTEITAKSFGRFAKKVQEFGGEFTLPVGKKYDIHPSGGEWAVVVVATGGVLAKFAEIGEAVAYAKAR